MSKIYHDEKWAIGRPLEDLVARLEPDYGNFRILKKAVDARGQKAPHWVLSIEIFAKGEEIPHPQYSWPPIPTKDRPLVVGSGPAGLFAALRLAERGIPCEIFERGSPCEKRILAINRFWRYNELDENDNVCFGEGGAGLYSDGKLITRIKSPHIAYVMNRLVQFGAPPEIEYLSNPHVGSDKIRRLIPKIRKRLIDLGCHFHFNSKVVDFICQNNQMTGVETEDGSLHHSPYIVLATGHSAGDIFSKLQEKNVFMEGKSFALGLRVEHPQEFVNQVQYREFADHPELGAANYKLTHHNRSTDIGVYSFCMCPGGYVLSSGTEKERLVCNGMSNYKRNSAYANAAIVVTVDHEKYFGKNNLMAGLRYREDLEHRAWQQVQEAGGQQQLPYQGLVDFMNGITRSHQDKGSSPSGCVPTRLDKLFDEKIYLYLIEALEKFNQKLPGFIHPKAKLYGVESRTSCPLRISRDRDSLESLSHPGLYPCGEGAGFAGGITSAACDGIRVAEAIVAKMSPDPSK